MQDTERALQVARVMIEAAREADYLEENEPVQSAPELAELEKTLFLKMFQELKTHLQAAGRMELSADEIAALFNFAVGKSAEIAYNYWANQKQDVSTAGMFDGRVPLYVDDKLMNFLKATPIAPTLGGAFLDSNVQSSDPILALFEALKWSMRITQHLTLKVLTNQR